MAFSTCFNLLSMEGKKHICLAGMALGCSFHVYMYNNRNSPKWIFCCTQKNNINNNNNSNSNNNNNNNKVLLLEGLLGVLLSQIMRQLCLIQRALMWFERINATLSSQMLLALEMTSFRSPHIPTDPPTQVHILPSTCGRPASERTRARHGALALS